MTRITLDADACQRLDAVVEHTAEICDSEGRVIGYFVPDGRRPGQPPEGLEIPLSTELTERRRGMRSGRTLDEILRGIGIQ
jgi:hypothetical protein